MHSRMHYTSNRFVFPTRDTIAGYVVIYNALLVIVITTILYMKMPPFSQNKGNKRSKASVGRCICRPSYIAATCFFILLVLVAIFRFNLNPVSDMKGLQGFTSKDVAEPHVNSRTVQLSHNIDRFNLNPVSKMKGLQGFTRKDAAEPQVNPRTVQLSHNIDANSIADSIQRSDASFTETSDRSMKKKKKTSPSKKVQSKNKASMITKSTTDSKNGKKSSSGKQQKKKKDWLYDGVYNFEPFWGLENKSYIRVIPSEKIPLKWERMILFPSNISIVKSVRPNEPPSGLVGRPRDLLVVEEVLERHPLRKGVSSSTLEEVIFALQSTATCIDKPIFLTMATVGEDLYWQLAENFVYTLAKYDYINCSLLICVGDTRCMDMCKRQGFPCYLYKQEKGLSSSSVMEQIAILKLRHIPKALSLGANVFMLDLDVGFLTSPQYLLDVYNQLPMVDIFVQEDYLFIMNRSKVGWGTWHTEPLPNIGLFLCRGNNRTAKVFQLALECYLKIDDDEQKTKPGTDQSCVLDAMRVARGTLGLKYAYFTNSTAPLLDKLTLHHGIVNELGGVVVTGLLDQVRAIAMHTTCYEHSTKVMGLKATSAFWNPRYYDQLRPTITKQLLYLSEKQLFDEVKALIWLAKETQRDLILPNVLGSEKVSTLGKYLNQSLWPGFRVVSVQSELKVNILEPSYYWRIWRDYDPVPLPHIVRFSSAQDLSEVKQSILKAKSHPRIILHGRSGVLPKAVAVEEDRSLLSWSNDSVGIFAQNFSTLRTVYGRLPDIPLTATSTRERSTAQKVDKYTRKCMNIFGALKGNRTCFMICL